MIPTWPSLALRVWPMILALRSLWQPCRSPGYENMQRILLPFGKNGDLSIKDIATRLDPGQITVSHHIDVPIGAGVPGLRGHGNRALYSLPPTWFRYAGRAASTC